MLFIALAAVVDPVGVRAETSAKKAETQAALNMGFAVLSEGRARNDAVLLAAAARLLGPVMPKGDPLVARIMMNVAELSDDPVLSIPSDAASLFKGRKGGSLFQKEIKVASGAYDEPLEMEKWSRGVAYITVYPKTMAKHISAVVETEFGQVECARLQPEGSGVLECVFDVTRNPNITLVLQNNSSGPITTYLTVQ